MRFALSALAVSAIMSVTPATATVVDFTNGANGANGTEENLDLTFPDFTIEVRAGVYLLDNIITIDADGIPIGGTTVADLAVSKRDAGLGVVLAGLPNLGTDVNGVLDLLTFSFDRLVNFNSVLFGNVDSNDDVDIFVDGVLFASDQLISGANPAALNVQGTQISFGADQFGLGFFSTTDDFTVAALDVSAVPLPTGVLFGLTGLAGLAAVSRRKRAQT